MAKGDEAPFLEQLAFKKLNDNEYETVNPPRKMGNPLEIAYGGYAIAVACKAACLSVPPNYHLYSMQGNYLGPAYTDRPLIASIRVIRQTRTFATRQVEVRQTRDDGEPRVCLIAISDFHVQEKDVLLEYSRPPMNTYPNWRDCPPQHETYAKLLADGKIPADLLAAQQQGFAILHHMYDMRPCPSGIFAQNLNGIAPSLPHTQDTMPPANRTTADWLRCKQRLSSSTDHLANLTFLLDGALSFAPLSFNHMWFDSVSAVSSLDFSIRFFANHVHVNGWLLRELRSPVTGAGRSYGESWVWDERGRAVACMSQQGILRPRVGGKEMGRGKL